MGNRLSESEVPIEANTRRVLTRSRKPLSDCTNSYPCNSSQSSLPVKPNKPNKPSSSAFKKPATRCSSVIATRSSNISNHLLNPPKNPNPNSHESPILSTPSPSLRKSSIPGTSTTTDRHVSEPVSVVCGPSHTSDKTNCDNASTSSSNPPSEVSTPSRPPKTFSVAGTIETIDLDVAEPISIVYSQRHTSGKRKNKEKAVSRPVSRTPIPKISNNREKGDEVESMDLPKVKALTVPCSKRQRMSKKDALLQDYIEEQKAYFKMIDEFELSEEEVESTDKLD